MPSAGPSIGARLFGAGITTVCLLLVPAIALAVSPYEKWADEFGIDPEVSYDGTRIMTVKEDEFEITERKAPQKMYTEFNAGSMSGAFILREDLDKAYMLMPSMGMYKEMSLSEAMAQAAGGMEFSDIQIAGEETINGYPSTKYKARFEDQQGKGAGFIWVTGSGVPIKMDMIYSGGGQKGMRLTSELVELNLRPQDPQTFELPEGLSPMGNMGMFGAAFGQQGQQGATGEGNTEEDSFGEELGEAAEEEAENAVIDETRKKIRKGLRNIFDRD